MGMLLSSSQCNREPSPTQYCVAPNDKEVKIENFIPQYTVLKLLSLQNFSRVFRRIKIGCCHLQFYLEQPGFKLLEIKPLSSGS